VKTKYLYLDDEAEATTEAIVDLLGRQRGDLEVVYQYPKSFSEQATEIMTGGFDGLLLDLRLDQVAKAGEPKADYGAFSLAQEIRARSTDGRLPDLPIILCSTEAKINKSFKHDDTSHDLFDIFVLKDTITANVVQTTDKMVALSSGYKNISKGFEDKISLNNLIRVEQDFLDNLDPRIWSVFVDEIYEYPPHEFARFLLRELIERSGPLIDEATLAARLGVDISRSPGWETIIEAVNFAEYVGPFHGGWRRWWAKKVENWWGSLADCPSRLRSMSAQERTEFLKIRITDQIVAASPIEEGYSEAYWTICAGTRKPLDPLDGLLVAGPEPKPWQDKAYLSIKAALERIGFEEGIKVNPVERDRLENIKTAIRDHE